MEIPAERIRDMTRASFKDRTFPKYRGTYRGTMNATKPTATFTALNHADWKRRVVRITKKVKVTSRGIEISSPKSMMVNGTWTPLCQARSSPRKLPKRTPITSMMNPASVLRNKRRVGEKGSANRSS